MQEDYSGTTDDAGRLSERLSGAIATAGIAIVALIVVLVGAYYSSRLAFWSSDCAARFVMVSNFVHHGSLIHLTYTGKSVDPTGQISPLAYYLEHRKHDFVPQYQPLFPFISALFYKVFGFYGLTVLPSLCGLGTVIVLYKTAVLMKLRHAFLVPMVAGLGTPIIIYSVVFWDHSAMMLCAAVAAFFLLRALQTETSGCALWAGIAFGVGLFIHELMIATFTATVLAGLPLIASRRGRQLMAWFIAGFIPFACLWMAVNHLIYGTLLGAHIGANMTASAGDHPFGLAQILDWPSFKDRAQEELVGIMSTGVLLTNLHLELMNWFNALLILIVLTAIAAYGPSKTKNIVLVLSVIAAGVDGYLVVLCHWANGLFEATPLFIPALAVPWFIFRKNTTQPSNSAQCAFVPWLSRSIWVYIILVIVNPMLPGVDWGSRYLLPILPYLVLLSAVVLQDFYDSAKSIWRVPVSTEILMIVGVSIFCQAVGIIMIGQNIQYNRLVDLRISHVPGNVVVYSQDGTGPEAEAISIDKPQYLVRSPDDWRKFTLVMEHFKSTNFTFVGPVSDLNYFAQFTQSDAPNSWTTQCTKQWIYVPTPPNPYCPPMGFGLFKLSTVPPPVIDQNSKSKAHTRQ